MPHRSPSRRALAGAVAAAAAAAGPAFGAAGDLDPSFGTGGISLADPRRARASASPCGAGTAGRVA